MKVNLDSLIEPPIKPGFELLSSLINDPAGTGEAATIDLRAIGGEVPANIAVAGKAGPDRASRQHSRLGIIFDPACPTIDDRAREIVRKDLLIAQSLPCKVVRPILA